MKNFSFFKSFAILCVFFAWQNELFSGLCSGKGSCSDKPSGSANRETKRAAKKDQKDAARELGLSVPPQVQQAQGQGKQVKFNLPPQSRTTGLQARNLSDWRTGRGRQISPEPQQLTNIDPAATEKRKAKEKTRKKALKTSLHQSQNFDAYLYDNGIDLKEKARLAEYEPKKLEDYLTLFEILREDEQRVLFEKISNFERDFDNQQLVVDQFTQGQSSSSSSSSLGDSGIQDRTHIGFEIFRQQSNFGDSSSSSSSSPVPFDGFSLIKARFGGVNPQESGPSTRYAAILNGSDQSDPFNPPQKDPLRLSDVDEEP